jgi:hypothetical protein
MRVVRTVAGIVRTEAEVAEAGEVGRAADACGVGYEGLRPHWWGLRA